MADRHIHETIKEHLKRCIESGEYAEGSPLASEHLLADQYRVSRNQTRKALRELEIEGYVTRSRGRRSVVAPAHQRVKRLAVFNDRTIAIALPEYCSQYLRAILGGLIEHLSSEGFQTVAFHLKFDDQSEMEFLRQIRASGVAGLAMWVQHDQKETAELLNSYARNQFPVVLMDRYLRESDVDFVVADNEAIGRQLTRKLIALGHQRIGLITSFPMATSGEDRARGFKLALEEAGLENGGYPIGKMSRRDGSVAAMQEVNRIMASKQAPTAFFCNHDALARELATQLRNLGYEIPGDVAIASVDDEHIPETMGIPMFTADQRGREIGEQTAEVLLARIREPQRSPDQRFITPEYRDYLT